MSIEKWKTQHQEVIFEHPRITLLEDTVLLPDGSSTKYLKFKRSGNAATIIAIREDGLILLQQEYSHPPAEVLYQFPGGGVPDGENLESGANRELMEECGLSGTLELIGSYYADNRRTDAKMYVFVARDLQEATAQADPEEFIEYDWYTTDQIDGMVAKGELKHSHVLAAWAVFKGRKSWQIRA